MLLFSLVLLLPALFGLQYTVTHVYDAGIIVAFSCAFAFWIKELDRKLLATSLISIALLIVGGLYSIAGAFAGSITTEQTWTTGRYKMEKIVDQGFAGRALVTYQLRRYTWIPIFTRKIDSRYADSTTAGCWVDFEQSKFQFNKCAAESSVIRRSVN